MTRVARLIVDEFEVATNAAQVDRIDSLGRAIMAGRQTWTARVSPPERNDVRAAKTVGLELEAALRRELTPTGRLLDLRLEPAGRQHVMSRALFELDVPADEAGQLELLLAVVRAIGDLGVVRVNLLARPHEALFKRLTDAAFGGAEAPVVEAAWGQYHALLERAWHGYLEAGIAISKRDGRNLRRILDASAIEAWTLRNYQRISGPHGYPRPVAEPFPRSDIEAAAICLGARGLLDWYVDVPGHGFIPAGFAVKTIPGIDVSGLVGRWHLSGSLHMSDLGTGLTGIPGWHWAS